MDESKSLLDHLRAYKAVETAPSPEALARRAVADQLRALASDIATSGASADALNEVAERLRSQHELLRTTESAEPAEDAVRAVAVPGMENFRDRSPITGDANPMAPPATLAADPDTRLITGEVSFGPAFEGAPGCVHGGFVSALLDEALGMACIFSGAPAMTAELVTRFRHHTPVETLLRVEARLVSVEGRKVRTEGEVYHGDRVVVEASGLFIAVDTEKFAQLAAARSGGEPG